MNYELCLQWNALALAPENVCFWTPLAGRYIYRQPKKNKQTFSDAGVCYTHSTVDISPMS